MAKGLQCLGLSNMLEREEEAEEMATEFLTERGWFSGEPTRPDHIL